MNNFASGNSDAAMKSLEPHSLIKSKDFKGLSLTIREQRDYVKENYGANNGWELATVKPIGEFLIEYMYLSRHEKYPLRWYFVLYNNGNGWQIINISYDDEILLLFQR